jgi:hypothetical protein
MSVCKHASRVLAPAYGLESYLQPHARSPQHPFLAVRVEMGTPFVLNNLCVCVSVWFVQGSGLGAGQFAVNGSTGAVTLLQALDFEAKATLLMEVWASDGTTPAVMATHTLNVVDVNDTTLASVSVGGRCVGPSPCTAWDWCLNDSCPVLGVCACVLLCAWEWC